MTRARCEESVRDLATMHDTEPQPLLGLHFRNILGDALCVERGLECRLSRVARGSARRSVRPELVHHLELFPELPSISGWVEAMTALGRLIFLDQPGTGASDPVEPGALPTLEQWTDSITAVLDALGSSQAVLITAPGANRNRGAIRGNVSIAHSRVGRAGERSRSCRPYSGSSRSHR
jgi:hypothetical protein